MTNEEAIRDLKKLRSFHNGSYGSAVALAIGSLEKMVKIEQIIQGYYDDIDIWNGIDAPYIIDKIEKAIDWSGDND